METNTFGHKSRILWSLLETINVCIHFSVDVPVINTAVKLYFIYTNVHISVVTIQEVSFKPLSHTEGLVTCMTIGTKHVLHH